MNSLGTNTKIPNTEHFEHWHTELRTFRTWPSDFETELRTGKTEHRTFVRLDQTWVFGLFLSFEIFFWQKNYKLEYCSELNIHKKCMCRKKGNFKNFFFHFHATYIVEKMLLYCSQMFVMFAELYDRTSNTSKHLNLAQNRTLNLPTIPKNRTVREHRTVWSK